MIRTPCGRWLFIIRKACCLRADERVDRDDIRPLLEGQIFERDARGQIDAAIGLFHALAQTGDLGRIGDLGRRGVVAAGMFGTTAANLKAARRVVAPRRVEPIANEAFIGRERNFRKRTAPFKVGPPNMPDPMVFPAIESG
jgi:hypothetical protein